MTEKLLERTALGVLLACACVTQAMAGQEQSSKPAAKSPPLAAATAGAAAGAGAGAAAPVASNDPRVEGTTPFQIGPEDILDISVWKNPELSRTVPVRPDGKVSLPLVNDIQAAG